MVPIPVMIPVVVPVVSGVQHGFAVTAALMPLGCPTGAPIELVETPIPITAAAIVPNITRRISYSPSTLAGDRSLAERLRIWECATAATGPVDEVLMAT